MTQDRVDWVDTAKGICIIFVVMMHSTLGVEKAAGQEGWMHLVVAFAAPFRMPDFFLISGLFLARVIDRNWLRYFDRKVVHFAYFYALWVTIQFAFKAPGIAAEMGTVATLSLYLMSFIEPFGTLWFIYILPIFFVLTKLAHDWHIPTWMTGVFGALLHLAGIETGWLLVDEFASRFVFFFAGYALAPFIFKTAEWIRIDRIKAFAFLVTWAVANGTLVWLGWASSPLFSLTLGFAGALALICTASLLAQSDLISPIKWLGAHSIVIYLAFFLPMAISRIVLLKTGIITDIGTISAIVTAAGVIGPAVFYLVLKWLNIGKFLFTRPDWAIVDKSDSTKNRSVAMQPGE
ncbi:MAG: acyltransferase family protein [Hyphomicrobiales bacterium]